MEILSKTITLDNKEDFLKMHFSIINPVFPVQLSIKEIEILAAFLALDEKLIEDEVFNTLTRKKVMEDKKLQAGGLGNHLKSMIDKKFLLKKPITNKIYVNPFCLPEKVKQEYSYKIVLKEKVKTESNQQ